MEKSTLSLPAIHRFEQNRSVKRIVNLGKYYLFTSPFERLMALLIIMAASPLIFLMFLYLKLFKPGWDLFFVQERFGQFNTPFNMVKFSTIDKSVKDMPTNQLNEYQDQISSFGKFLRNTRINELPQLYNVLNGKMRLVGPRPAIAQDWELLERRNDLGINNLKPGIAFIDRIYDDKDLTLEQRMRLEKLYLKERSFQKQLVLDIWIIAQSVVFVIKQANFHSLLKKFRAKSVKKFGTGKFA